ncbi:MAG: stage 0 sporulation protein, partial [Oscillospiraceae bacterium]|nr:stage 0 sporulation protein [Oscillospiraceae bacterium]
MIEIVGVRFENSNKVYYFDPKNFTLAIGTKVIVETTKGIDWGTVTFPNRKIPEESVVSPLRAIIRIMNKEDFQKLEANRQKEKKAFRICEQKIQAHN